MLLNVIIKIFYFFFIRLNLLYEMKIIIFLNNSIKNKIPKDYCLVLKI